ncbi:MAG: tRNA (adenosine(37)-N6)-threonylcarbamoyltransferase complex ATPase subunit type 1 TsaE [Corynebacterium sp.]|nr:tRNA (adenosine(37)-N6)-threonylcarbamoyltransferase complex ATPase subunit type 1 TsaE [Corynebacterium sp.]
MAAENEYRLETAADTQALGERLGAQAKAGELYILDGPLGAGKTTFTQGFARGMQVKGRITSPTFVIAREHRSLVGGPTLIHVDAYRLLDGHDVDPLDALESLDLDSEIENAVVVAEWGGQFMESLASRYTLIHFDRDSAFHEDPESNARIIRVEQREN